MNEERKMVLDLKKEGNKIIASQVFKDQELTDKNVLDNISEFEAKVSQLQGVVSKAKTDGANAELEIPKIVEVLNKFVKFKEWAIGLQESKCRVAVEEHLESVIKKIDESYVNDPALTTIQNNLQKYKQSQQSLANIVGPNVNSVVWRKAFFLEPIFMNPWDPKVEAP